MRASRLAGFAITAALSCLPLTALAVSVPVTYVIDSRTVTLSADLFTTPETTGYCGFPDPCIAVDSLPEDPTGELVTVGDPTAFALLVDGIGPWTLSALPTGPPLGISTFELADVSVTSGAGFSSSVSGGPDVFDIASMGPFEVAGSLSTNGNPFVPYATLITSDTTGQLVLDPDGSIQFTLNDVTLAEIVDPGGSGDFVRITGDFVLHGIPVPEPGVLALVVLGLGALAARRRGLR